MSNGFYSGTNIKRVTGDYLSDRILSSGLRGVSMTNLDKVFAGYTSQQFQDEVGKMYPLSIGHGNPGARAFNSYREELVKREDARAEKEARERYEQSVREGQDRLAAQKAEQDRVLAAQKAEQERIRKETERHANYGAAMRSGDLAGDDTPATTISGGSTNIDQSRLSTGGGGSRRRRGRGIGSQLGL